MAKHRIYQTGAFLSLLVLCPQVHAQSKDANGGFEEDASQTTLPTSSHASDLFKSMQKEAEVSQESPTEPSPKPPEAIKNSVARCFSESRARDSAHQGRVEMKVNVNQSVIRTAEVLKNETGDPLVPECLVKAVSGLAMTDVEDRSFEWAFSHQ